MGKKKLMKNILMTLETHTRLKMNAAMMELSIGDLIEFMVEGMFPFQDIEERLNFARGVKEQEKGDKSCS